MGLKVNMKETNGVVCTYLRIKEAQLNFDTNEVGLTLSKYVSKEQRDYEKDLESKKAQTEDTNALIQAEYEKAMDSEGNIDSSKLDSDKISALSESLDKLYEEINSLGGNYVYSNIYVSVPYEEPITMKSLYKELQKLDQFKDSELL